MEQEQNIIEQIREDIITNNNTAQVTLDNFIKDLKRHIEEIIIPFELHGDIDLSVFTTEKFVNLRRIVFREGELTSIRNVPNKIDTLICANNILKELNDLPGSLLHLDCRGNHIYRLDLSKLTNLQQLFCQDNKLTEINNIPKTLVEFVCENNQLKHIDLSGLNKLDVLSTSNNSLLIIENLPTNIKEHTNENNQLTAFDTTPGENGITTNEIKQKIDYTEAIDTYFRIKDKYEKDTNERRHKEFKKGKTKKSALRKARGVKPNCLNCHRPVGMIFDIREKYTAMCGDTKEPCKFNIILTRGNYIMSDLYLEAMTEIVDDNREEIIKQKMDTIFEYISEDTSARVFKEKLEEFNINRTLLNQEHKQHNEHYNNAHTDELIKKKQDIIHNINQKIKALSEEYKENGNTSIPKLIVNMHINDLIPETENLRRLKYDITEMDLFSDKNNDILIQYEVAHHKIEENDDEEPTVETFVSNL